MAFWGDNDWIKSNNQRAIIDEFNVRALQNGCYRLSLGNEAIVSSQGFNEKKGSYRKIKDHENLYIQPGQFAFLITKETVSVPANAIGFINIATSIKFEGLDNISGFHVDPFYNGKLIFTVFNAGPHVISLHGGQQLFRLWLSDFGSSATTQKKGYQKLPTEWASKLHGTYPSPFALARQVSELERKIDKISSQRIQATVVVLATAFLLLPFTASLYANVFYSPFGNMLVENIKSWFGEKKGFVNIRGDGIKHP